MAGSPPSARKKPQCHTCGNPMAGHKRVSGRSICPTNEASDVETELATPPPQVPMRTKVSVVERRTPPPTPRLRSDNRGPSSHSRGAKRERVFSPAPYVTGEYDRSQDASYDTDNDLNESQSTSRQLPTASKLGPTKSSGVFSRLNTPLASIFTAPRSDIKAVQQEAGRRGLYTGTVYKPRKLREEASQRWVVMGRDAEAVERLVDFQKESVARQLELETRVVAPAPASVPVGAITVVCNGPSKWRLFFTWMWALPFAILVAFHIFGSI